MRASPISLGLFGLVGLACLATSCSSDPSDGSSSGTATPASASFKDDVVPILATSCALAACHSAKESNLGIHLTYDEDQIYSELQRTSPTPGYGGARFVVPGKPEESILMAKLEGTQGRVFAGCSKGCGTEMPPGEPLDAESIEIIRTWIKNGAKRD